MIVQIKDVALTWAHGFDVMYAEKARAREPTQLKQLQQLESASDDPIRHAMGHVEFSLFAAMLIHHGGTALRRQKIREVEIVTGNYISPRQYSLLLDRGHHYLAGVQIGRTSNGHSP